MSNNKVLQGMREAIAYAEGNTTNVRVTTVQVPAVVDVRAVREKMGMTQEEFSERFGFSYGSVRNWEQKRRQPEGPARTLLALIDRAPDTVIALLT